MFRFIFLRLILPVLLFLLLRYVLKSVAASMKTASSPDPHAKVPPTRSGGELKKDPVCGTYVPAETAVTRVVGNEVLHFCSPACRDKYQA